MMNLRNALLFALSLAPLVACSGGSGTAGPLAGDRDDDLADGAVDEPDAPGAVDAGKKTDAGSKADAADVDTTCANGTLLTAGKSVTLAATKNGANPQRDYCIVAPANATVVEITMKGGSCAPYACIGDDVVVTLKQGAVPNAFEPDGKTKQWTYTPAASGFGTFGKSATGGVATYIAVIDGANTLGYTGVSMSVAFK